VITASVAAVVVAVNSVVVGSVVVVVADTMASTWMKDAAMGVPKVAMLQSPMPTAIMILGDWVERRMPQGMMTRP